MSYENQVSRTNLMITKLSFFVTVMRPLFFRVIIPYKTTWKIIFTYYITEMICKPTSVSINYFNYRASWSDKSWMFFFLLHSNSSARSWLLLYWCFRSSRSSRSIRIRFLLLLFWPLQFGFDLQACYFAADARPWLYFVFLKHELYSFKCLGQNCVSYQIKIIVSDNSSVRVSADWKVKCVSISKKTNTLLK